MKIMKRLGLILAMTHAVVASFFFLWLYSQEGNAQLLAMICFAILDFPASAVASAVAQLYGFLDQKLMLSLIYISIGTVWWYLVGTVVSFLAGLKVKAGGLGGPRRVKSESDQ